VSKLFSKVSIGAGITLILCGAVYVWLHSGIWATYWILLGIYFILLGRSFTLGGIGQKITRRLSFGFLGVALVFLGIGLAPLLS
jgi:hypothetical protein